MIGIKYDKLPFIGKEGVGGGGKPQMRKKMTLGKVGTSQEFKDSSLKLDFPKELYKKEEYVYEEPPIVKTEKKRASGVFNRRTYVSLDKSINEDEKMKPGCSQNFDIKSSLKESRNRANRHSAPDL